MILKGPKGLAHRDKRGASGARLGRGHRKQADVFPTRSGRTCSSNPSPAFRCEARGTGTVGTLPPRLSDLVEIFHAASSIAHSYSICRRYSLIKGVLHLAAVRATALAFIPSSALAILVQARGTANLPGMQKGAGWGKRRTMCEKVARGRRRRPSMDHRKRSVEQKTAGWRGHSDRHARGGLVLGGEPHCRCRIPPVVERHRTPCDHVESTPAIAGPGWTSEAARLNCKSNSGAGQRTIVCRSPNP